MRRTRGLRRPKLLRLESKIRLNEDKCCFPHAANWTSARSAYTTAKNKIDLPWISYISYLPPPSAVEAHTLVPGVVSENPLLPKTSPPSNLDNYKAQVYCKQFLAHTSLPQPARSLKHLCRTSPCLMFHEMQLL
jgi:hypothetical protein